MSSPVHILITVRKPELLAMALLVFRTLRVGFPTAPVYVWGNGLAPEAVFSVVQACTAVNAQFHNLAPTTHDAWIEQLVLNQAEPFWICDADIVFLAECEWICEAGDDEMMAGRFEPTWHEPWTDSIHVERLHTCLLWLNPPALRGAMMRHCRQTVPEVFSDAIVPFIRQHFVPVRGGKPLFYDSTAGLWHALGGKKFTDRQNAAFEHLHCGSYSDAVGQCEVLKDLPAVHAAILANPACAAGIQQQQNAFYAQRAIKPKRAVTAKKYSPVALGILADKKALLDGAATKTKG